MAKQRILLKDLADQLGLNVATVSKALKDYPDISEKTKKKVQDLAKELNYLPDTQAGALRGKRSYIIGLVVPEIVHFFFANVINGIMDYAEANGYRLLVTISNNSTEREKSQLKLLFGAKVDGVLASLANETEDTSHFNLMSDYGVPVVLFDKVDDRLPYSQVIIDDKLGAYEATMHLIRRGCKRIAHIRGPKNPSNARQRFQGYQKALDSMNLPLDPSLVKECKEVVYDEGYEFATHLLRSSNPPDGIFAVTDAVGVGAMNAARDLGFSIPEDLKIVGFSDSQIAKISNPGLTTIHQSGYTIGENAARLLLEEISQKERNTYDADTRKVIVGTRLVKRGST